MTQSALAAIIITAVIVLIFIGITIFSIIKGNIRLFIILTVTFSIILTVLCVFGAIFELIMKYGIFFFRFF